MDWNPRDYISVLDECWYKSAGRYAGSIAEVTNGTGASVQDAGDEVGRAGIIELDTGSTSGGYATLFNAESNTRTSGGVWTFQASVRIDDNLSAAGERFTVVSGWRDDSTVATAVQYGLYFRYQDNVNGGRWEFVGETAGHAEQAEDTGVAATTDWVRLGIVADADNDEVNAYIDDELVATITDPDAIPLNAIHMAPIGIYKVSGSTRRYVDIDYYRYAQTLTTPR